jgi:molybdate transport system substrate-binding protein
VRRVLQFAVSCAILAGCTGVSSAARSGPGTLTVFAASSLTEAFSEIGASFERANPGADVTFSFASSRTLRTQIGAGAPADVFASASMPEMESLGRAGMVAAGSPRVFLTNRLVVILPSTNPAGIQGLQDLSRPGLKLVLAAEEAPVGNYSRQALQQGNAGLGPEYSRQVLANVVSNEDNVKKVVAKVQLGEADAAIVYASDAVAAPDLKRIEIPAHMNITAQYPIAALSDSDQATLARRFVEHVLSPAGQAILGNWGFGPAD